MSKTIADSILTAIVFAIGFWALAEIAKVLIRC